MAPSINQDLRSTDSLTKKYKLVKPLVQGSQASVELWSHITTGELVAVKTNHNDYTLNQHLVHIDSLNNCKIFQNLKDPISREAHILSELHQHNVPGVVPFKGIFNIPDHDIINNNKSNYAISNPCFRKHLVLGYCDGGDLLDLVDRRPHQTLNEDEARKIIKSLVHTLRCCHALGIMHRAIKLENIFLMSKHSSNNSTKATSNTGNLYNQLNSKNNNNIHHIDTTILADNMSTDSRVLNHSQSKRKATPQLIKPEVADQYYNELEDELFVDFEETKFDYHVLLGDFGVATYFDKSSIQLPLKDPVGSLYYMAPEVIRGMYDKRADIWSLGIVLHCLLTGSYPFSDANDNEQSLKSQILKQDLDVVGSPEYLELSSFACDLLTQMLDKNPETRITLEGIKNHTWLSEYTTEASSSCKRMRKD